MNLLIEEIEYIPCDEAIKSIEYIIDDESLELVDKAIIIPLFHEYMLDELGENFK